jgi:hypothetical protein
MQRGSLLRLGWPTIRLFSQSRQTTARY